MLRILLIIIFLIAAAAVTIIVLLQEGKSAGLGSMTGATGGDSYWERNKKHSLEGKFEKWTKLTAVVFVLSAFLIMLIPNGAPSNGATTTITTGESAEGAATTDETATDDATTTDEATADDAVATDEVATDDAVAVDEATADEAVATDEATADDAATDDTVVQSADSESVSN